MLSLMSLLVMLKPRIHTIGKVCRVFSGRKFDQFRLHTAMLRRVECGRLLESIFGSLFYLQNTHHKWAAGNNPIRFHVADNALFLISVIPIPPSARCRDLGRLSRAKPRTTDDWRRTDAFGSIVETTRSYRNFGNSFRVVVKHRSTAAGDL